MGSGKRASGQPVWAAGEGASQAGAASRMACRRGKSVLPEAMTGISGQDAQLRGQLDLRHARLPGVGAQGVEGGGGVGDRQHDLLSLARTGQRRRPERLARPDVGGERLHRGQRHHLAPDLGEALGPADDRYAAVRVRCARCRRCRTSPPPAPRSARRPRRAGSRPSRSGRGPAAAWPSTPATGSSRCSIAGEQAADRARPRVVEVVQRQHRAGLGRAVAFEDRHPEAFGPDWPGSSP